MALKDMNRGNMYPVIRRFLTSNVGKRWDELYSKICSTAPISTELGREIRHAVGNLVDINGPEIYPNNYYVDTDGLLQINRTAIDRYHSKSIWKARRNARPIFSVNFKDDGKDIWYMYVSVSGQWKRSEWVPSEHKEWFQFTRRYIEYPVPVYQYEANKAPIVIGTRIAFKEEVHRRQCNSKEVKKLRLVTARKVKILKLTYNGDEPGLMAYVAGSIKDVKG